MSEKYFHVDRTDFSVLGEIKAAKIQDAVKLICEILGPSSEKRTISFIQAGRSKMYTYQCTYNKKWDIEALPTIDLSETERRQFAIKNGLNASHKKIKKGN